MSVVRWRFLDIATSEEILLPLNPNTMSTPTETRNLSFAWGVKVGVERMRAFQAPPDSPAQWTFGGVILEQSHYDLLVSWSGRLSILRIQDHIGRQFKVMIQKFDPVERRATPSRPWKADYTMTCLFLERIA